MTAEQMREMSKKLERMAEPAREALEDAAKDLDALIKQIDIAVIDQERKGLR